MSKFSLLARAKSFVFAGRGVLTLMASEHNARIHLLATVLVVGLAAYVDVVNWEWAALLLAMALVWVAEGMNTAIEYLADAVTQEDNDNIMHAKDVAAGAVLIAAGFAVCVAVVVFLF